MERKRPFDGEQQEGKRTAAGGQIIKMLCPDLVTGSVIGKGGEEIKSIKAKTNAVINVAKAGQQYPGAADERPIAIKGNKQAMMDVVMFVQDKIYNSDKADEDRKKIVKLVVPDTSAGRIIGRGGETVKRLRSTWGVDLSPTGKGETPDDLDERIVSIDGEWDNVVGCLDEILDMIVNDPKSIMELEIDYSQWAEFVPKPVEKRPRSDAPPRGPPRFPRGASRGGPPRGMPRGRGGPPRGGYGGYGGRGGPPPRGYPPRGGPRGRGGYGGGYDYGYGGGYGSQGGYYDRYNDYGY